jgi:hypothetical protein
MFGFGEKYSKEGFEEAKKEAIHARDTYWYIGGGRPQRTYDELIQRHLKAQKRLEAIYAKGQKEATALNEEYDHLQLTAQKAIQAVADFERDKLGVKDEEVSIETENTESKE